MLIKKESTKYSGETGLIVIGGGPAGIMSAIKASEKDAEVLLIEKNRVLGRKLLLTGGGRCNLTNACDMQEYYGHYSRTGSFLRDPFKKLTNNDLRYFFKTRGLDTKIEESGRVFPVTDKASSVLDVLVKELEKHKVKFLTGTKVQGLRIQGDKIRGVELSDGDT